MAGNHVVCGLFNHDRVDFLREHMTGHICGCYFDLYFAWSVWLCCSWLKLSASN